MTCKGKNCSSDGRSPHSSECRFEHAQAIASGAKAVRLKLQDGDKDWKTPCQNCGEKPTVHPFQLCGPCCFGEAETYGGNW